MKGLSYCRTSGTCCWSTAVKEPPQHRVLDLYEKATDILVQMREATGTLSEGCRAFQLAFDEAKLMQELDLFLEHFVQGLMKLSPTTAGQRNKGVLVHISVMVC